MKLDIPNYQTKKELFDFLILNKETLISQKKSVIKLADGIGGSSIHIQGAKSVNKSQSVSSEPIDEIKVKAVINTTNFLDSHGDVHIPGIWNKSLKENTRIMHIQEHQSSSFDKIIASGDDLKASAETMTWKELGYNAIGTTQALVFESTVKESRNKYMFNQYKQGFVDNHSVGMRYVKMELAINDKDYEKEKNFYDKYITQVINKEDAEALGYFWVVTEAKVIEGSAVPMGSNPITPTTNIKNEPSIIDLINQKDTQEKAADSTFSIIDAINNNNFNLN
mgnify:FL=1|tara:strand:- start:2949 stop:3788 length:840 start_codon:yes stop_codon:yes gene_type:complete